MKHRVLPSLLILCAFSVSIARADEPDRLARDVAKLARQWAAKPRRPRAAPKNIH